MKSDTLIDRSAATALKIGFVSLGCAKNTVDSEVMLGHLARDGAALTSDPGQADVIVVNTCGFIDAAREESIETILEMARLKTTGRLRRLVVAGCLVQRHRDELEREIPEIDAFVDLDGLAGIGAAAGLRAPSAPSPLRRLPALGVTPAAAPASVEPDWPASTYLYDATTPRLRTSPPWTAWLKMAEGCDNTCAFCAIPSFRGRFRSRPLPDILLEARRLAGEGVREINLVAQDSTAWGSDLGLSDGPARLLDALSSIESLRWIRLFYVYPNKLQDSLLDAMAGSERVARYVDMPLQHASRAVLARMRRGGSADSHLRLLDRIRTRVPGVTLRTTVLVGFPGETAAEFRELLAFLREASFDHLGAFAYSHERGTPAISMADDVPSDVKEERRARVMELQERIALRRARARIGDTLTVLCEGACPETEHLLQGRHEGQAPEVDGRVLINEGSAAPGTFVRVRITAAHPFDLVGRVLQPS